MTTRFFPNLATAACSRHQRGDPNHAFAVFATSGGSFGGLSFGRAGPKNHGQMFGNDILEATPFLANQGIYDLALGIAQGPADLTRVGGIELWRSGPNQQAELAAYAFDFAGQISSTPTCGDVRPLRQQHVAADGGIYKAPTEETYIDINRDLAVTQFASMDAARMA